MATTPPGWYDDGHGALRWWDGAQWTEHVAEPDPEPAIAASDPAVATTAEQAVATTPAQDATAEFVAAVDQTAQPQGYPGADPSGLGAPAASDLQYSGAFVAATEPNKSKLWIVWVVLGVVLLGIVIAAAIVIPLIFFGLSTSGNSSAVDPANDEERAAIEAVELYDRAWDTADCEAYFEATTEEFRATQGATDCAEFNDLVTSFNATTSDYVLLITDIDEANGGIIVATDETYLSAFDAQGNPADPPAEILDEYEYTLVPAGQSWAIDNIEQQ